MSRPIQLRDFFSRYLPDENYLNLRFFLPLTLQGFRHAPNNHQLNTMPLRCIDSFRHLYGCLQPPFITTSDGTFHQQNSYMIFRYLPLTFRCITLQIHTVIHHLPWYLANPINPFPPPVGKFTLIDNMVCQSGPDH